jgi:2-methylcitrate dehydratase
VEITFADGRARSEEIAVADAHPMGARPFARAEYLRKFRTLTEEWIESGEGERFLNAAQQTLQLRSEELEQLNIVVPANRLSHASRDTRGIF